MEFLKKAKTQVKGAVNEAQGIYSQYKQQQQYYQPQHGSQAGHYAPSHQHSGQPAHYHQYPPSSQGHPHGYGYQHYEQQQSHHAPPQSYGSYAPPLPTPPSDKSFDMTTLGHALAPAEPLHSIPPSPPRVTDSGSGCPRHQVALVERVQFYVFKSHVLSQARPTLHPDNFAVCSACYTTHIAPFPALAQNFEPRKRGQLPSDAPQASMRSLVCDMALPTVRQMFYRDCTPRSTVVPLLQFTNHALTLPECTDTIYTEPTEWFSSKTAHGFGVCKACFEWYIRGTSFERDFSRQAPAVDWYCDIGHRGYSYRALVTELLDERSPDLKRFANKVKKRAFLDHCAGNGDPIAPADSRGPHYVYDAVDGKTGVFCQACFLDHIQGTSVERYFNTYVPLDSKLYGDICCDLSNTQSVFAMKAAARAGDDEVWRRCVTGRQTLPACAGIEGVDEQDLQYQDKSSSQWYCFTKHPSIEVCQFCYCATVEVLGAAPLFSPIRRPLQPGVIRMCFLAQAKDLSADVSDRNNFENTLVWRGTMLRNWLHHGFDWHGNFIGLESVAETIAALPPPCITNKRALTPASGRKWYGNHYLAKDDEAKVGVRVCEDCYAECVKGTALEWFCGIDLTDKTFASHPDGFVCNTPSKRSRAELKAACESGDFLKFSAYWTARADCERRRKEVDALCNAQAEKQRQMLNQVNMQGQMQAIGLMQQLNAHQNATIMGIGGSVAEAAAPDYGQRYGNSTIGYGFLTANGAHAAQAHVDAQRFAGQQQGLSAANFQASGDTWRDTQNVLALAKAIEKEWEEIF